MSDRHGEPHDRAKYVSGEKLTGSSKLDGVEAIHTFFADAWWAAWVLIVAGLVIVIGIPVAWWLVGRHTRPPGS
jgi:hypothetical protein